MCEEIYSEEGGHQRSYSVHRGIKSSGFMYLLNEVMYSKSDGNGKIAQTSPKWDVFMKVNKNYM